PTQTRAAGERASGGVASPRRLGRCIVRPVSTPSRQLVVIASVLMAAGASICLLAEQSRHRVIEAGFWFEPVSYDSPTLGGPVTSEDMQTIAVDCDVRAGAGVRRAADQVFRLS